MIKYILMNKEKTQVYASNCVYDTEGEGLKHKERLQASDNWIVTEISIPMQAGVKPDACEFTAEQLNIIGIALENWLIEDTCISISPINGKPFIDKKENSKTFFERLIDASKHSV